MISQFRLLLILFLSAQTFSKAQGPLAMQWNARYGGTSNDVFYQLLKTLDGGFIMGGYIESDSSADVTGYNRDTSSIPNGIFYGDFWIVKTNSVGNIQWNKRFGGEKSDVFTSIKQTPDSGYIMVGRSYSSNGDHSQANWNQTSDPAYMTEDMWVIKTDASGNKQWDKRFGGMGTDHADDVMVTNDGGFLISGISSSSISGDKTQDTIGPNDYWLVRTDAAGNKLWDKVYGGPGLELGPVRIIATSDGGYLLGGISRSGAGAFKTDTLRDTLTTSTGFRGDYWVVKIDSGGTVQWDKTFGGASVEWFRDLIQTSDGGYLIAGYSWSEITGDVTDYSRDTSSLWYNRGDYWIVKTDASGNKLWDKKFGGEYYDRIYRSIQTIDQGFLLIGNSVSDAGGDKTEDNYPGASETWIVKTDSSGILEWDKTIITGGGSFGDAVQKSSGCYVIASAVSNNIVGYCTIANRDTVAMNTMDYWFAEFCDSLTIGISPVHSENILLYPNPVAEELNFIIPDAKNFNSSINYKVTDMRGAVIFSGFTTSGHVLKFKASLMMPGIYFVEIITGEMCWRKRFIKL
jgi:hypothetical protein